MANGLLDFKTRGIALSDSLAQQSGKLPKPKMLILAERQLDAEEENARYGFQPGTMAFNDEYYDLHYGDEVDAVYPRHNPSPERTKAIIDYNVKRDSVFNSLSSEQVAPYAEADSVQYREDVKETRIFSQEANWFAGQNPDLDVEVRDFRGVDELSAIFKDSAEKYKGQNLSLGIFGHAGNRFGGVNVNNYKDIADTTGFNDSCNIDEVLMGSCNFGTPQYDRARNDIAGAFKAKVTGQNSFFGTSTRTSEDIQAFKDTGVSDIGSRLFNPGSVVNSVEFDPDFTVNSVKKRTDYLREFRTADSLRWEDLIESTDERIASGTLSETFRARNPYSHVDEAFEIFINLVNTPADNLNRPTLEDLQAAPQRPEDFINIINQIAELP